LALVPLLASPAAAEAPDQAPAGGMFETVAQLLAPTLPYFDLAWNFLAAQDWIVVLLVLFNGLLALFTYRLWRSTAGMREGAREQSLAMTRSVDAAMAVAQDAADAAKRAAEAALLQARAAIGVELPRLELSDIELQWADQSVRQALKAPSVRVAFTNHGRTTAFVGETCVELRLADALPPEPLYRNVSSFGTAAAVASGGSVGAGAERPLGDLAEAQSEKLLTGQSTLWVYGFVGFRDFLGARHRLGFCLCWTPPLDKSGAGGAFVPGGPERYTYQTQDRLVPPAEPVPDEAPEAPRLVAPSVPRATALAHGRTHGLAAALKLGT
jgi:hypothetical protein